MCINMLQKDASLDYLVSDQFSDLSMKTHVDKISVMFSSEKNNIFSNYWYIYFHFKEHLDTYLYKS